MENIIRYGRKETEHLSQRDKKLGAFIEKTGYVKRAAFGDLFSGLCFNIINQ